MANVHLVTGYQGSDHIYFNDVRGNNVGEFGDGNYVLAEVGNQFECTVNSAVSVTIGSGEGIIQGSHFRIESTHSVDLQISNGVAGVNRNDLICARYTKDENTGVEEVNLVVVEGTPSTSAVDPEYNTGDIVNEGATIVDFPLWRIRLEGLSIQQAERMYSIYYGGRITTFAYPVGSIYKSTKNISPAEIFGGTWEQITNVFLLACGDTYSANSTGGSATKTITTANLPSHSHGLNAHTHSWSASGSTNTGNAFPDNNKPFYSGNSDAFSLCTSSKYSPATNVIHNWYFDRTSHTHSISASGTTGGNSGNTTSTGGGSAFDIMPPYKVIYVWKRVA